MVINFNKIISKQRTDRDSESYLIFNVLSSFRKEEVIEIVETITYCVLSGTC